jgi:hypothetical protein
LTSRLRNGDDTIDDGDDVGAAVGVGVMVSTNFVAGIAAITETVCDVARARNCAKRSANRSGDVADRLPVDANVCNGATVIGTDAAVDSIRARAAAATDVVDSTVLVRTAVVALECAVLYVVTAT